MRRCMGAVARLVVATVVTVGVLVAACTGGVLLALWVAQWAGAR